jgi:superfamily I DNA/RNA helicase
VLARTNAELRPAVAAALSLGVPFRAPGVELLVESPLVEPLLDSIQDDDRPLLVRVDDAVDRSTPVGAAVLGWAAAYRDLGILRDAVRNARTRLASLRRDDAELTIATAHGTKGLEWDHVVVLGMDAGRFPSRRAVESAPEPHRALEEERRLAYVAWTRARVSLTLLYDPAAPSSFLLEAFTAGELALDRDAAAETRSA